ncbi:hypothetical protein ACMAZF_17555 [Psychrobium sp. nBUS_13]
MFFVLRRREHAKTAEKYSDKEIEDEQANIHILQLETLITQHQLFQEQG